MNPLPAGSVSSSPAQGRSLVPLLIFLVAAGAMLAYYFLQPPGGGDSPIEDDSPTVLARERATAFFDDEKFDDARSALAPLLESKALDPSDLVRAVNIELADNEFERALELLARAEALTPDDPAVAWSQFRVARDDGRYEDALRYVRRAHELRPDDYPTKLGLANTLNELSMDDEAHFKEADRLYQELLSRGKEYSGSWYLTTLYRYHSLLRFSDREEESMRYLDEFQRLSATGMTVPQSNDLNRGTFGNLAAPPIGALAAGPTSAGAPAATQLGPELGSELALPGVEGLRPFHLFDDAESEVENSLLEPLESAPAAVLAWGSSGIHVLRFSDGALTSEVVSSRAASDARVLDLDAEERAFNEPIGPAEIVSFDGNRVVLFEFDESNWSERELMTLPGEVRAVVPVDFDHEGDLDLLVVGAFGARLYRNDGAGSPEGSFVDASELATLPSAGEFTWATIEDLDSDQDVDLFFGGKDGLFWWDNERGGKFRDRTVDLPKNLARNEPLVVADFDGDGVVDVASRAGDTLFFGDGFGDFGSTSTLSALDGSTFEPTPMTEPRRILTSRHELAEPREASYPKGNVMSLRLPGVDQDAPIGARPYADASGHTHTFSDLDGDRTDEWIVADDDGVRAFRREIGGNSLRLWLAGDKDNRRGVGAIVEVRSGPAYRRHFWEGEPKTIHVGDAATVDMIRVNWPNGVTQTLVDVETGRDLRVKQKEGLIGSCPFLYTWNGEKFVFISDVIGITPLGLPMAPGMLVPPDHDEYVLVRGDQLRPKDGEYILQFTEELREVTYLDRVRLDVIDHPATIEIYPNERFTFPPFPEAHTHTIDAPLVATKVTASDGNDWTEALAANDEVFAMPFENLRGPLLGLATPHFYELEFEPERLRDASKLRLVMNGWFYWTDASVNMASSGHPNAEFTPPLLMVPDADAEGGWKQVGPPLGFPAGKLKTMVCDVTPFVNRDDPRIRIFSSLRLYWDSIRLAVCDDDAEFRTTSIEPASAELFFRGFSAPSEEFNELGLEWFEWDELELEPRWNQHPGLYTKYGECVPLLGDVDDRYVIMGSGDCLTLRFDANEAPPLPEGWTRDYLLYLDGWAKDRDPNSHEALFVEPLPFHGMSGYPYGEDESFPDDPEHEAWRREWNTRPSRRLIESIKPVHANR